MPREGFHCEYTVSWDDLDPNEHVRGGVIIDYLGNTQFSWIEHYGYGPERLFTAGYGPATSKLEVRFLREIRFGEVISDYPRMSALAPDGSIWRTVHELRNANGKLVATAQLEGTWIDWKRRAAIAPEPELLAVLNEVERTPAFETAKSVNRQSGNET